MEKISFLAWHNFIMCVVRTGCVACCAWTLSPFLHAALAFRLLFGLHCTVSLHVCDELSTHWTGTTGEREKNAKKLKNESDTKPIGVTYFFFSVLISFLKSFHGRRSLVRTQFWYTSEVFYDVLRLRSHAIIFYLPLSLRSLDLLGEIGTVQKFRVVSDRSTAGHWWTHAHWRARRGTL